jgi:hypothetical protein
MPEKSSPPVVVRDVLAADVYLQVPQQTVFVHIIDVMDMNTRIVTLDATSAEAVGVEEKRHADDPRNDYLPTPTRCTRPVKGKRSASIRRAPRQTD